MHVPWQPAIKGQHYLGAKYQLIDTKYQAPMAPPSLGSSSFPQECRLAREASLDDGSQESLTPEASRPFARVAVLRRSPHRTGGHTATGLLVGLARPLERAELAVAEVRHVAAPAHQLFDLPLSPIRAVLQGLRRRAALPSVYARAPI